MHVHGFFGGRKRSRRADRRADRRFFVFFGPHEAGKQQTRARGGCAAQPALGAPGGGAEGARSRSVTVATAPTAAAAATAEEKRGNTRSPRCGSLPWQRLSPATASAAAATVSVSPPPTQSGASKPGRGLLLFALLPRERDLPAAARPDSARPGHRPHCSATAAASGVFEARPDTRDVMCFRICFCRSTG